MLSGKVPDRRRSFGVISGNPWNHSGTLGTFPGGLAGPQEREPVDRFREPFREAFRESFLETEWGGNRQKQFRRFSFFFCYCILGFYGVYIIPKWLIKVPGPIAILFG